MLCEKRSHTSLQVSVRYYAPHLTSHSVWIHEVCFSFLCPLLSIGSHRRGLGCFCQEIDLLQRVVHNLQQKCHALDVFTALHV